MEQSLNINMSMKSKIKGKFLSILNICFLGTICVYGAEAELKTSENDVGDISFDEEDSFATEFRTFPETLAVIHDVLIGYGSYYSGNFSKNYEICINYFEQILSSNIWNFLNYFQAETIARRISQTYSNANGDIEMITTSIITDPDIPNIVDCFFHQLFRPSIDPHLRSVYDYLFRLDIFKNLTQVYAAQIIVNSVENQNWMRF
jgi:hypothetical protein